MSVVPANYLWAAGGAGTIGTGADVVSLVAGVTEGVYAVTSQYGTATVTVPVTVYNSGGTVFKVR